MWRFRNILFFASFFLIILIGCKKDDFITDSSAALTFSTDTVYFDTILSSLGSVTHRFKIYNPHESPIMVKNIYLGGGDGSHYRLNINGIIGNIQNSIEIPANDSIFVFVEVTIDPLSGDSPMVISDSVICETNGNFQNVKLVAFGQNVHLFRNEYIPTQTWTKERPYLIYNVAGIDTGSTLTIEPGTMVYFTNESSLMVWGKLEARGTKEEPIVFTSSRFDRGFETAFGQWKRIYIAPQSNGCLFDHVIIKNADEGLRVGNLEKDDHSPYLELSNSIINNCSYGILGINATIDVYNTILSDCNGPAFFAVVGGNYNFYQCTISNIRGYYNPIGEITYYKTSRSNESVAVNDFYPGVGLDDDFRWEEVSYFFPLKCNFYNSIIYGTLKDEFVVFDSLPSSEYKFENCILKKYLKTSLDTIEFKATPEFVNVLLNNPRFINDSITEGPYNLRPDSLSPALDAGQLELIQGIPQLQFDFDGNSRTADGKPDLGAYERVQ